MKKSQEKIIFKEKLSPGKKKPSIPKNKFKDQDKNKKIKQVFDWVSENSFDGFLGTKPENIQWISGFQGSFGMVLVLNLRNIKKVIPKKALEKQENKIKKFLITDARYFEKAKNRYENSETKCVLFDENFSKNFGEKISGKIGIEDSITLQKLKKIKKYFKNADFIEQSSVFEGFRSIKTETEIEKTKIAAAHVDTVLKKIPGILCSGITEKEVCFYLENLIRNKGKFRIAFDSIVAFGENSANPHHSPTNRTLKENEPVLIDCGAVYKGYHSDITRNWWFGDKIDPEYKKTYEILLEIQISANKKCIEGAKTSEIDTFVRNELKKINPPQLFLSQGKKNLSHFFSHSLGHGTGLEIHEQPNLSKNSSSLLEENNIITCEPGLYFPDMWGIRIEDQLVVKKEFCCKNILTNHKKKIRRIL